MKPLRILATTIAALLVATPSFAVIETWDGGGASDNINTAANWLDNTAPLSDLANTDLIFTGGVRLTPNLSVSFNANSLTFDNLAGAFTFGGSALAVGFGGITNNDAQTQTFNNIVTIGTATSAFNAASGGLVFNSTVALGTSSLTLSGANAISMLGAVTGTGTLQKTGAGALTLALAGTSNFDLVLDAGNTSTIADGLAHTISSTGSIAANGTSFVTLNENLTLDGAQISKANTAGITIANGKTLTLQNGADATFSGGFANGTSSTVVVTGAGSTFVASGGGMSFNGGTLTVAAGGSVSTTLSFSIGALAAGGTVTVDGSGSSLSSVGNLTIAQNGGAGSLTLSNSATGTFGSMTVTNSGIAGTNGTLSIQSGATVTGTSLVIGSSAVANSGTVTINGAGSILTISGAGTATIGAASANTANFNVQSGGTFNSGTGTTAVNATGVVNITGGTYNANGNMTVNGTVNRDATGSFTLAATRTLTVQGGGEFNFTGAAYEHATASTVTVTGAGSTLSTNGGNQLRFRGGSTVNVLAGANVTSGAALLLATTAAGGNATVLVDGAGSTLSGLSGNWGAGAAANVTFSNGGVGTIGGNLTLAGTSTAGTGATVNISSGATLSAGSLSLAHLGGTVTGTVTIDGAGSTLTLAGGGTIGSLFSTTAAVNVNNGGVFNTGNGVMTVANTGVIAIAGGTVNFQGAATFDASDLTLTGASSALTVDSGRTVLFQNGADITTSGTPFVLNSPGTVMLTGSGTTLVPAGVNGFIVRGGGTVNLLAGATASGGAILLGDSGDGTLIVDGPGSSITDVGQGPSTVGRNGFSGSIVFSNAASGTIGSLQVADSVTVDTFGGATIETGADLSLGALTIGHSSSNATGSFNVVGAGSTAVQAGASTLTIGGSAGSAMLSVDNSGIFTTGTGAATVNATGTVAITGGTFNANGNMTLNGGQLTRDFGGLFNLAAGRTLTIQNGGDAVITGFYNQTNASTLNVTGASSTFTSSLSSSFEGGSAVNITAGGDFITEGLLNLSVSGGNATVLVDGVGSGLVAQAEGSGIWGNAGHTAAVTFSNGGTGSFFGIEIANGGDGSVGTVTVQSGSSMLVSGRLKLANTTQAATATLTVNGAGSVITHAAMAEFVIGSDSGSSGTLSVQNGGTFNSGETTVNPTGTVAITGGTFNANNSMTLNGSQLTAGTGSIFRQMSGTLTVNGAGDATFFTTPSFALGTSVVVTGVGTTLTTDPSSSAPLAFNNSSLAISVGGVVTSDTFLNLGVVAPTSVTVDGAGSSLNGSTSFTNTWGSGGGTPVVTFSNNSTGSFGLVNLGLNGNTTNAVLNVQSGADVTMAGIAVANTNNTTQASVNVGGAGSTLTFNHADLVLGSASGSTATLNVTSGGTVTTISTGGNNLVLNPTGTVNLNGGSLILGDSIARNGGVLNFNSGLLSLDESLTIGVGGLIGGNVTLDNTRQLIVGPTHTTTVNALSVLTLDGGTFSTGALVNNGTLDFQRGNLAVTGASGLNIGTGALGANVTLGTGANLSVTNTTTVASGATLRLDGGTLTSGGLGNSGTLRADLGTANVTSFINSSGGRFFIDDTLGITATSFNNTGARVTLTGGTGLISGSAIFANNGGLVTGDGTIATTFNNNGGELRAESGKTIYLTGAIGANSGNFNLLGGTLDFANAITNHAAGFISGRGALHTGGITNNGVMAFSGGNADIRGDVTNASGARIVTSGAGSTTTFFDDVVHNGTEIFTGAGASTVFFGSQSGAGAFTGTGTVYYTGDLRPGNSPATVNYGGNVVFSPSTELTLEIGGLSEGTQYDSLQIANALTVDGILTLMLINGFAPSLGNVFDLIDATSINGTFDALSLPTLAQYLAWNTSNLYTTGEVSIGTTLTPIEQWRLLHFGTPANSGDGADDNDFDKDGSKNLLEYALGLDPLVPSTAGLPTLSVVTAGANSHIALTVTRPLSATDITYQIEVGGALVSFLPGSSYSSGGDIPSNANTTQVSRTDDGTFETIIVRDNTPLTGTASRFLRLKVSRP